MSNGTATLPQITIKAFILGIVLAAILAGANAYLGLFAGMTVSSAIPAAVISMAVLRLFATSNILENNIVQTTASAGSAVSAGVVFTLPALYLLGAWPSFGFIEVVTIAGLGGILGVLFSVPLRRALILERKLPFPEGQATAEVLKAGDAGSGIGALIAAALIGAGAKLCEVGLKLWSGTAESATYVGKSVVYFGTNVSPALIAVGVIVGLNIGVVVFSGGALAWYVFVPLYSGMPDLDPNIAAIVATNPAALDLGYEIWDQKIRYIGVGAMLIGGLWSLIDMRHSLLEGIRSARAAHMDGGWANQAETDRELPINWVVGGILALVVPIFLLYVGIVGSYSVAALMALMMVVAGFMFSAVSAYMSGLVGSSNNPISGMTIATLLFSALALLWLMGPEFESGAAAAILIGAVVACAAAIGGDNLQDLKAGHLVGATPWKQQVMLAVGAFVSALVMAPVLNLLVNAYGIGAPTEAHPDPLSAPQANLMASVADGVFGGGLPWDMIIIGAVIGAVIIGFDKWLEVSGKSFRVPVLAAAIGIYLPLEVTSPILIGGILAYLIERATRGDEARGKKAGRIKMLLGAGLIAGEALIGIVMAVPIVVFQDPNVIAISNAPYGGWPGLVVVAGIGYWVYRKATAK
jgi:putative OPT family oligopeptide transporter